jgi:hypothetical protein
MCFSQEMSGAFSMLGLYLAWYVYSNTTNMRLAVGVFYFFLMEFLQFFQFLFIDDCNSFWNQFLTFIGFVHICYQPYFTHIINSSLTKSPKFLSQYDIILRLCLLGGTMLLFRYILADWGELAVDHVEGLTGHRLFEAGFFNQGNINSAYTIFAKEKANEGSYTTSEWLRGEKLCTYKGNHHLAWSVPMTEPTYWTPSAAIHSFLMFAPFFVMKKNMVIQGVFLWLAGPYLASYITSNLMEQASIWCFFSIGQIGIMLILIREQLLVRFGNKGDDKISVFKGRAASPQKKKRN